VAGCHNPFVSGAVQRIVFSSDRLDEVLTFCARAPVGHFDAALRRRLLMQLTSDPTGTIVLADQEGLSVVATVIDVIADPRAAAELVVLGARGPVAAAAFVKGVLDPASRFAGGVGRAALILARPAFVAGIDGQLERSGFVFAYESCRMRLCGGVRLDALVIQPPDGWRFVAMDDALVRPSHAVLIEIFRGMASATLPPFEEFRVAALTAIPGWRVLLDGGTVAGLVRLSIDGAEGEVRVLGRRPAYRGRGIGRVLLDHGLRVLASFDVNTVHLEVEARNDRALDLYRSFDFEVVERTSYLRQATQQSH
jgi:ribosomal protein S18 acetylase RimI-like enzyme